MPDTIKTRDQLYDEFPDNTAGDITPEKLRDFVNAAHLMSETVNLRGNALTDNTGDINITPRSGQSAVVNGNAKVTGTFQIGTYTLPTTAPTTGQILLASSTSATAWGSPPSLSDAIPLTAKGAANGVATLDGVGKVPITQMPVATTTVLGTVKPDGTSVTIANGVISAAGIPVAQKGVANGVATLDSNLKIPTTQLPLATTAAAGVFRPDGTTITVSNGVLSATGILASQKGVANGVASLDANGKVPAAQLPIGIANGLASLDANLKVSLGQLPVATADAPGIMRPDGVSVTIMNGIISANREIGRRRVIVYSTESMTIPISFLGHTIATNTAATYAWTLPVVDATTLGGWYVIVKQHSGTLTVTPGAANTIDGSTNGIVLTDDFASLTLVQTSATGWSKTSQTP